MHWRWSVDLCKLPQSTELKNCRVMVAVEHYSRFAVLVPIKDKASATVAAAFKQHVIGVFGAPAEVLTDNGTEFDDAFTTMCQQAQIDRRWTSKDHPQSNGATERIVGLLKKALMKMATVRKVREDWDQYVPDIALAYNTSSQASTSLTPYTIVFARAPGIPSAAAEAFEEGLDVLATEGTARQLVVLSALERRMYVLRHHCIMAGRSLEQAQHRQGEFYLRHRAGGYQAPKALLQEGDFIYLVKHQANLLDMPTGSTILKIVQIRRDGNLICQGRDRRQIQVHVTSVSPCRLQTDVSLEKMPR